MNALHAGDLLDHQHALMHRLVREPRRPRDVAQRIDVGFARESPLVDHDVGLLDLHLGALEAEVLDIPHDADRRDHAIHGDLLAFAADRDRRRHVVGALLQVGDRGAGQNLHALLLERSLGERRDLFVLYRQDARQHLAHGHLGAHGAVEARELDADRARADHQQRLRHRLRHHRLAIAPDQLAVGLEPRKLPRARAGRQDDVLVGKRQRCSCHSLRPRACPAPASLAVPSKTVILFFFISPLTPLLSWPATLRDRSTIFL